MKITEYTPKIIATKEDNTIPLLQFIYDNFSFGSVGVEFGSGHTSTYILGEKYMMTSFEENQDYMDLRYRTRLVYSAIIDGWFELETIKRMMPKKNKFVFIDAPSSIEYRRNILRISHIFEKSGTIIYNLQTQTDYELAIHLSVKLKRNFKEYKVGECRFAVIGMSKARLFFHKISNFLKLSKKPKIEIELNNY